MDLLSLLKEMFDNYPEVATDYEESIMDRYQKEIGNEKDILTTEEIANLLHYHNTAPTHSAKKQLEEINNGKNS